MFRITTCIECPVCHEETIFNHTESYASITGLKKTCVHAYSWSQNELGEIDVEFHNEPNPTWSEVKTEEETKHEG